MMYYKSLKSPARWCGTHKYCNLRRGGTHDAIYCNLCRWGIWNSGHYCMEWGQTGIDKGGADI